MSPRPVRSDGEPFEPALELARQGGFGEAIDAIIAAVRDGKPSQAGRAEAVAALTAVARLAGPIDADQHLHALSLAVELAPRFPDLHYRLGCARLRARDVAGARASLEEALRLHPGYVAARLELALLDAREGLLGEALDALRRLSRETDVPEPRAFGRGIESLEHADWDEAGTLLRGALQIDEPGVEAIIDDYHDLVRQGRRAEAARRVRVALREHGRYADLHYLLGLAELEDSHLDDAIASLARALELHPDFHAARLQLARALEAQGDRARAEDQVARVLEADPAHPLALEMQGRWGARGRRRRREPGRASGTKEKLRKAS